MNVKHGSDWICSSCGDPNRKYSAKDLCARCYARQRRKSLGIKPNLAGKYIECRFCGGSPIKARGLCHKCYDKYLEAKHPERRRQQKYRANQKKNFGGRREWIITMANHKCQLCGMTEEESLRRWNRKLDIHHKDGNGRTSENINHAIDNLLVICRECHMAIHHPKGEKIGVAS